MKGKGQQCFEADVTMDIDVNDEFVKKDIGSLVVIMKAFEVSQEYFDRIRVQAASDALWQAKRALFDSFHEQKKGIDTQTLIVEPFDASYTAVKYVTIFVLNTALC